MAHHNARTNDRDGKTLRHRLANLSLRLVLARLVIVRKDRLGRQFIFLGTMVPHASGHERRAEIDETFELSFFSEIPG